MRAPATSQFSHIYIYIGLYLYNQRQLTLYSRKHHFSPPNKHSLLQDTSQHIARFRPIVLGSFTHRVSPCNLEQNSKNAELPFTFAFAFQHNNLTLALQMQQLFIYSHNLVQIQLFHT